MDNREAKFILNAYRPRGQDASDPRFTEALEQARRDPVLERWLGDSIAFDTAMTEKLRAIDVPPDLRENIIAGAKASYVSRWKDQLRKCAIAAAVILCATLAPLIWHNWRPAHLAGWQSEALDVVSSLVRNESKFDAQSHHAAELVGWLLANHAPAVQKLPPNLEKLESLGCKTFSWNGTPVSVICFVRPDGGLIHLALAKAADGRRDNVPRFVQQGDWATATWRSGGMIYMLALEGRADQLRSYVL
jgi:hypothetical protein